MIVLLKTENRMFKKRIVISCLLLYLFINLLFGLLESLNRKNNIQRFFINDTRMENLIQLQEFVKKILAASELFYDMFRQLIKV